MPVVHTPTFKMEDQPPLVRKAIHACGALYVKTKKATVFMDQVLADTREALIQEYVRAIETGFLVAQRLVERQHEESRRTETRYSRCHIVADHWVVPPETRGARQFNDFPWNVCPGGRFI